MPSTSHRPEWEASGYVFCTQHGRPRQPANFRRVLARLCRTAGVRVPSPHSLRHTFASIAMSRGVSADVVARLLGHKNATVTLQVYGHVYRHELQPVEIV